jgi:hypothetical protein
LGRCFQFCKYGIGCGLRTQRHLWDPKRTIGRIVGLNMPVLITEHFEITSLACDTEGTMKEQYPFASKRAVRPLKYNIFLEADVCH